jgi:hypothetical protein
MIRAMPNHNDITKAIKDKDIETLDSYLSHYMAIQEEIDKIPAKSRTYTQKIAAKQNSYTMDRILHGMQVIKREFKLKVKAEDIKVRVDPIAYGMYIGQMRQYAAQQDRESARKPKIKTQKEIDYEVQQAVYAEHDKKLVEISKATGITDVRKLEEMLLDTEFGERNVWSDLSLSNIIVGPMNEDAPPPDKAEFLGVDHNTPVAPIDATVEMADWEQRQLEEDEAASKAAPRFVMPEK